MLMLVNGDHHLTEIISLDKCTATACRARRGCLWWWFVPVLWLLLGSAQADAAAGGAGAAAGKDGGAAFKSCIQCAQIDGACHRNIFGLDRSQSGKLGCRLPGNFLCCCKKPPAGTRIYGPLFLTPSLASAASKHGTIPRLQISFTL